jgi:aminoglycoside phosphotransferase (APT) family kinase protein
VRPDTREVRPSEQLDWPALASYLREHLPPLAISGLELDREMEVSQFPGGHSNLTYLVSFGAVDFVLRRPPLGPVPPRAHDMAREYRWLAALNPVFPLAPHVYLLCTDPSVVGSVFYVMQRRSGLIVRHEEPPLLAGRPDNRRRASEAIVDALAALHRIDVSTGPLSMLGKPEAFVRRQVMGWTERWMGARTTDVPGMDLVAAWLAGRIPPEPSSPAVVHGDYKLDNVMIDPADPSRLVGIFDWEMCALGDPLVDVGILLAYWTPSAQAEAPGEPPDALTTVTGRPGYLGRDEIVARYAARSGRDVSTIAYYEVFALFKIAVVLQQIYVRYLRGQTDDPRFGRLGDRVALLAREAETRVFDGDTRDAATR